MITTVVIELYYRIGKKSTLLKGCSDSANESNLLSNLFREEVPYHGLRDIHRERAEKEEICVISGNDLKRLGERLKHFVWHGNK